MPPARGKVGHNLPFTKQKRRPGGRHCSEWKKDRRCAAPVFRSAVTPVYIIGGVCNTVVQLDVPLPVMVDCIGLSRLIPDRSKVKVLFRQ